MKWQKSSLCRADEPMCAEVYGLESEFVAIRDSKRPNTVVTVTREEWQTFIDGVKRGEFDLRTDNLANAEDQLEQV
jgi:hypothetical protein